MTADPAILKTDHIISGSLANFVSPMCILFSNALDTPMVFLGIKSSGAQNTSEVQLYIGHFFGDQ